MRTLKEKIREVITDQRMPPYLYTYPTKKSYKPFTDWKKACESWRNVTGPITIYLNILFCGMKCSFCDRWRIRNRNRKKVYLGLDLR